MKTRGYWPHIVLLALACLAAYAHTLSVPFYLDDSHVVLDNPRIRSLGGIPSLFCDIRGSIASRPLFLASLALNYGLHGLAPAGYHAVNIGLHAMNACLLFSLIRAAARRAGLGETGFREVAFLAAMLFAVHPVQTEAVTYITSRSALMSAFFMFAGLLVMAGRGEGRISAARSAALLGISLAGMASREDFVTFPAVLMLFDFFYLSDMSWRASLAQWRAYAAASLPLAYLAYLVLGHDYGASAGVGVTLITPADYWIAQTRVHLTYLRLLLLPVGQTLDYDYPVLRPGLSPAAVASISAYVSLWAAGIAGLFIHRPFARILFLALCFLLLLAPTSSFMPLVDVAFEHRLYAASAPALTLMAAGLLLPFRPAKHP